MKNKLVALFDPKTMVSEEILEQGVIWVATQYLGKKHGKDLVKVRTLDSMVLLDETCPVGEWLLKNPQAIPGGEKAAPVWRANWGLNHPEDLREVFREEVLSVWASRMMLAINEAYKDDSSRQLILTGNPGDVYMPSYMDVVGDLPYGDAIVKSVVPRHGLPQHGLSTPEGSPLLLATVEVK